MELSTLHIKAPHEIHIGAKARAALHGKSMNQYVVDLIRSDLGEEGLETARAGIKLYRGASPVEKKTLLKASKIIDKMKITPEQMEPKEHPVVNQPIEKVIKENTRLCKHGSPKGECWSKEAPRLKCNVV